MSASNNRDPWKHVGISKLDDATRARRPSRGPQSTPRAPVHLGGLRTWKLIQPSPRPQGKVVLKRAVVQETGCGTMLLEPKERCMLVLLKFWRAFGVQPAPVYRLAELAGVVAIEKAIKISQPPITSERNLPPLHRRNPKSAGSLPALRCIQATRFGKDYKLQCSSLCDHF
jgi:hypothetical protein